MMRAILLFLVLSPLQVFAQVEVRPLDEERWRELTEELDFRDELNNPNQQNPTSAGEQPGEVRNPMPMPSERKTSTNWLAIALIAVAAGLLLFLILRFVNPDMFKRAHQVASRAAEETPLEQLPENELRLALRTAIKNGDFRQAVRIYYLLIISELAAKRFINWHIEKTNNQYLREMTGHELAQPFALSTRNYERVWFGQKPVNSETFHLLEDDFQNLLQALS